MKKIFAIIVKKRPPARGGAMTTPNPGYSFPQRSYHCLLSCRLLDICLAGGDRSSRIMLSCRTLLFRAALPDTVVALPDTVAVSLRGLFSPCGQFLSLRTKLDLFYLLVLIGPPPE